MAQTLAQHAEALEAQALTHPRVRDSCLLQAAILWSISDRAHSGQICTELIEQGSKLTNDARLQLVNLHLEDDDNDLSRTQLTALAADPALSLRHCETAAQLLEAYDDLPGAADWYDRAAVRLTGEQLDAVRNDTAAGSGTATLLSLRQEVRRRLGEAPDELDLLVTDDDGDDEELNAALAAIDRIFGRRPGA